MVSVGEGVLVNIAQMWFGSAAFDEETWVAATVIDITGNDDHPAQYWLRLEKPIAGWEEVVVEEERLRKL